MNTDFHRLGAVIFMGERRAALRDRIPSHFLSSRRERPAR
jgi:hypothetical protein